MPTARWQTMTLAWNFISAKVAALSTWPISKPIVVKLKMPKLAITSDGDCPITKDTIMLMINRAVISPHILEVVIVVPFRVGLFPFVLLTLLYRSFDIVSILFFLFDFLIFNWKNKNIKSLFPFLRIDSIDYLLFRLLAKRPTQPIKTITFVPVFTL
jgi:hypothetical protein